MIVILLSVLLPQVCFLLNGILMIVILLSVLLPQVCLSAEWHSEDCHSPECFTASSVSF
jgi:hypothetical protein